MVWNNIKKNLSTAVQSKAIEVKPLKEGIEKVIEVYDKHIAQEIEKDPKDRILFKDDEKAVIVALQFPTREDQTKGIAYDHQIAKNKTTQWWGPRIPLLNNAICTVFFPEDWEETVQFGWANEASKDWFVVMRGSLKEEYSWTDDPDFKKDAEGNFMEKDGNRVKLYNRSESQFVREAKKRFNDSEIKSISDLKNNDFYLSEVDRVKYTFNPNQILKVIK